MAKAEKEQATQVATEGREATVLAGLLDQGGLGGPPARKTEVERAMRTLAEWVLRDTVVVADDVVGTIKAIIAEIDAKLTEQVNLILHHEKFQALEGSWRGLQHLVNRTETDSMLKIQVMDISKQELGKALRRFKGANWDRSPLFTKVYEQEYGTLRGEPFGCLVGDYHFDHSPGDVETLGEMAKIAAAAHAPFLAGAAPSLMGLESWQDIATPKDLKKIFDAPEYAAWRALREAEDSRYVGLAMPRFLSRLPYGAKTNPVEEFEFEEETGTGEHDRYTWSNAAYAMAANITRSFKLHGWCSRIRGVESGGVVDGLPVHTFPSDDGGVDMKCPTEVSITDRRENELGNVGLLPLVHAKNSEWAVFIGAQSLQKPKEYADATATENAKLSANLTYMFAMCRFAHYLKCIVRDKLGGFASQAQMQRFLSDWIAEFVLDKPEDQGDEIRAQKPLKQASVIVTDVEGSPGEYTAKFRLVPHYHLEKMNISLSLVSRMPKSQG